MTGGAIGSLAMSAGEPRAGHPNTLRVQKALRVGRAAGEIRELTESTRTAPEAALGVPVGAIVKSLVFVADDGPVLVLASGDHQVDLDKVAGALGAATVARADADIVRSATGFPIGGVAPVGHVRPLRTLVDTHLATYPVLWAAAGTPRSVFPTTYVELLELTAGVPTDVAAGGHRST
jgi:prolyl-tRNA editing enzyme YbaK/EbsC (Cys-tRNA(Pro) deacylase)